ncbi:MAG: DUF885 domain-containing protein [Bdellovibrionota bacterium]
MSFLLVLLLAPFAHADWIADSNQVARDYAVADGARFPERASAAGLREFDGKAIMMEKNSNALELEFLQTWHSRLHDELAKATDENLRLDLRILSDHLRLRTSQIYLEEKFGVVSFIPGTRFVLESLLELVNDQSSPERKAAAVERFHHYVQGDEGHPPLLVSFQNRAMADELRFTKKRLMPLKAEVEQYLAESPAYLKGVREILAKTAHPGWESDYEAFTAQAKSFDDYMRGHVLPLARKDFKLPKEIYAHELRMRGIEESPEELIRSAHASYKEVYKEFRSTAQEVAKEQHWKTTDPAKVIRELKKRQVLKPEEVKPLYEQAENSLEEIIRRENLVTLPKTPLRIRVAGEAESLANPVPHLTEPPLVGNKGERPEFVVPSFASGKAALDDFSYQAAALVLTAHEGRPGHDLQFSSMLDNGTSMIRARYAFNNANVEGWGLYAEEMMLPYLPKTAQLVALQMRLVRVARAFFDPEVQLGKIRPQDVTRFLTRELGISDRLAALELRRYQYDDPGQAPAYFYGLQRMESAKRRVASSQGRRFSDQCFHDGVLSLGMMPVGLIGAELEKNLHCRAPGQAKLETAEKKTL